MDPDAESICSPSVEAADASSELPLAVGSAVCVAAAVPVAEASAPFRNCDNAEDSSIDDEACDSSDMVDDGSCKTLVSVPEAPKKE